MIKPKCDLKMCKDCEGELKQFGAILLSSPKGHTVKKYHVCVPCFEMIIFLWENTKKNCEPYRIGTEVYP